MPIRPSSGAEVKPLITALGGTDDVQREAAIARLAVIGPRAVEHLLKTYPSATSRQRTAILRALEAIADARALPIAREALHSGSPDVSLAAAGTLRALLASADASKDALDTLMSAALDVARPTELRVAACEALRDLPRDIVQPIRATLGSDPDPLVRAAVGGQDDLRARWQAAVEGDLPSRADTLKDLVASHQATARLTELQRLVDHVRAREHAESDPSRRAEWRAVRGSVHQALAARGSRLALYDLRDSLQEEGPLPVTFLAAIEEIGDASCVEVLAGAYDDSSRSADIWWREHLAGAFRAIVRREGLTRRHLVVKRALARWPEATSELMARV
jgi:HEAT repeat protein